MKNFIEKFLNGLPYSILVVLILAVVTFILRHGLHYDQLVGLIDVLIWPAIVLSALIFFRKVFTYLFFSMEEFNFFGNRGSLKNIKEVIDERVQRIYDSEKKEKQNQNAVKKIESELEIARLSNKNSEQKADENLKLAREIFETLKLLSTENDKLTKENASFREEKAEREARAVAFRERMKRRREEDEDRQKCLKATDEDNIGKSSPIPSLQTQESPSLASNLEDVKTPDSASREVQSENKIS